MPLFSYKGNPKTELLLPKGDKWRLLEDWWFVYEDEDGRIEQTVPAGYVTDFGSIPWFYRWRFSPTGPASPAFLSHDWLYFIARYPRRRCDRVMRGIMECIKVNGWDRGVMWLGVFVGGWTSYGKKKNAHVEDTEAV